MRNIKDQTTIELKDGYLQVTAEGIRDDFESLSKGSKKISDAAKKYGVKYILVDYRKLKFNVPMADAFNIVKMFEQEVPVFSNIIIGAVVSFSDLELARFWESICNRRGYKYSIFTDLQKCEEWINSLILGDKSSTDN